jgi:hypothetical protein
VPTENIRRPLCPAWRPDRQAKQIKIVRSEMRLIEPAHDHISPFLDAAARELISPSAAKLSER